MTKKNTTEAPTITAEEYKKALADVLGAVDRMVATQPSQINWPAADRDILGAARTLVTEVEATEPPAAKK